jgi:lipopolysaccharide transport system ATP-binding protein
MAVQVEHLWKTFQIPHERRTTIFENLVGIMRPNRYETLTVLKDVSFKVDVGECVGIIGDNGSGKSTLLKIIANILRPNKGRVKVDGKMTPFLELGVGFQPDLTVKENIGVYATVMGLSRKDILDRTDSVIDFAGLRNFEDTKLKNLSSGMQVRLAFSTAIQTDPDVLLVDEVLAVGDMEFQQKCFDVFNRYRREGVTILFVSHDMGSVRKFCDKTLLLNEGQQTAFGESNRIIDKYIYESISDIRIDEQKTNVIDTKKITKKVEIRDVKILDKNMVEKSHFISGDPVTIRIYYQSHDKVRSPIFGIALYHQEINCYGTTTDFKGCDTGLIDGRGYVDFTIDKVPFLAGKVEITAAIASSDYKKQYDWHDRLYSFIVHNLSNDAGLFSIDCQCKVIKDA